jgi:Resolvase, N terminal domain
MARAAARQAKAATCRAGCQSLWNDGRFSRGYVAGANRVTERLLAKFTARGVKLALGESVYDPTDPMGKMFFNILATFAEFEAESHPPAHPRGHGDRPHQGQAARQAAQALRQTAKGADRPIMTRPVDRLGRSIPKPDAARVRFTGVC